MSLVCPNCHHDNPDGARFCFNCAIPLDPSAAPTESMPTTAAPPVPPPDRPGGTRRTALPWVLAAIGAAVVAAVIVVVVLSGGGGDDATPGDVTDDRTDEVTNDSADTGATTVAPSTSPGATTTPGASTSSASATTTPTPTTAAIVYVPEPEFGSLRLGHQGPRVMALQTRLNELGYRDGAPDGRFGPVTDAAVRRFQADNGLTVDGFAGPVTHAALELPFWEKIDVSQITAEASSTNPPSGAVTYDVGNLLDDDDETSWQSTGADIEGGVPVTVTFTFAAPVEIDRLSIANGYEVLDRDTFFTKNARVRELKLVSGAQELTIELADDKEPQLVDIAFGAIDTLTLEVVSVYPGDEFPEVALTEVVFLTNSGA